VPGHGDSQAATVLLRKLRTRLRAASDEPLVAVTDEDSLATIWAP
jgi:hypothetical protein